MEPVKEKSGEEETFMCEACGENFGGKQRLNLHVRTHHGRSALITTLTSVDMPMKTRTEKANLIKCNYFHTKGWRQFK